MAPFYFKAISVNYKQAGLAVREKLSLSERETKTLLHQLKDILGISEALVLSTCNRTEIYYLSEKDYFSSIIHLLCQIKNITNPAEYHKYFISFNQTHQAVEYLFRVSIGLESQVIGDLQISNQVKKAYQWTADENMAGPFLHRLLHTIFFTNKRVVQETAFRDGAASVSYAAVELTEELCHSIIEPKVLVVGLGEIGADVARNFKASERFAEITVMNRTFATAQQIAQECGFRACAFERLWQEVEKADVIISSMSLPSPLFDSESVQKLNFAFKYFIDLSVPRSVAREVEELPGVLVYDIDHINIRTSEALERRKSAIPQVESIVNQAIQEFLDWSREMIFSPTIQKLKSALEQIRQEEISKYLKRMDTEEAQKIDMITKNIMQKIIKLPVLQLKAACKRGEAETLVDVLNDLFNLESVKEHKH
ncbi:MAG: glutamyl-tRNA reductase [Cytophagales bacterium]|nr:glutamyl-tRNA reductase [Cytophagales bacterium]MDW8383338.1 glutamyl-tRNA reductase [Flammeovirgaceae bacterium]